MPVHALLLALAATQAPVPAPPFAVHRSGRLFISPMGEPFIATAPGEDPLATWFSRADSNHDGYLSAAEMQQDATRFFATLDLNHDGEIDPDELTNYETVIAPQVHTGPAAIQVGQEQSSGDQASDGDASEGGRASGTELTTAGPSGPEGAARFGLLNIPEPVAAADTNLDRGVTADEFRQAAIDRFQLLDTNHDGRLTLPELEALRPALTSSGSFQAREGRIHGGRRGRSRQISP